MEILSLMTFILEGYVPVEKCAQVFLEQLKFPGKPWFPRGNGPSSSRNHGFLGQTYIFIQTMQHFFSTFHCEMLYNVDENLCDE
jgi:hypothetical protein